MEAPPIPSLPPLTTTAATVGASLTPKTSAAPATVVSPHVATSVPDSVDSSPKSRTTDVWDDPPAQNGGACTRIRLMCSYGGHIVPRPHDKVLSYLGGDTRIVVVDRGISLSALVTRLSNNYLNGRPFTLKYQLPSEDLDSLISVTTDEDLDNMIDEYERTVSSSSSVKPSRLRLFLFTKTPDSTQSMGQILESTGKSDDWFLNALNSAGLLNRGFSDSTSVNNLLGLDDVVAGGTDNGGNRGNFDFGGARDGGDSLKNGKQQIPAPTATPRQGGVDVNSVPDSPMLERTSSFGSASSSPSIANLPPIRVHVEDASGAKPMQDQKLGIEDQFSQINLGGGGSGMQKQQQQQNEGFIIISCPPPSMPTTIAVAGAPVSSAAVSNEYHARIISDDERSDQGAPIAYRKPPNPSAQLQNLPQPLLSQQKPSGGGGQDLPSPDSVSSDNSLNNALSRQKPAMYQDPVVQIPPGTNTVAINNVADLNSNASDPNARVQIKDSSYILQPQFEQQTHAQAQTQHHPQFVHAAPHLLPHHPTGAVPLSAYLPVYPPQSQTIHRQHLQLDQHSYPVYYVAAPVSAGQAQAYNVPVQQSGSKSEAPQPGSIPSSHMPSSPILVGHQTIASYNPMGNGTAGQPEMGSGGAYRTTTGTGGAQLVQVPLNQLQQQQFFGYSQMHHQAQSVVAPGPGGNVKYGYEFADPAHAQMYFSQPLAHGQYQTMVLPDGSTAQLPNENVKPQVRSS